MEIRSFQLADEPAVIDLWRRCGLVRAVNDPVKDVARKMKVQGELFLVAVIEGRIVGSVMCGYEGHRGSVNYLGVLPEFRGRGVGRGLMGEVERLMRERGCPKINLNVRAGNEEVIKFYRAIGFVVDEVICMGKRLEKD